MPSKVTTPRPGAVLGALGDQRWQGQRTALAAACRRAMTSTYFQRHQQHDRPDDHGQDAEDVVRRHRNGMVAVEDFPWA